MKLLIVAGPYEADLIRRAAVQGGIEAVAVEAGESLPGWIAASRPDLLVLATRTVHAEPAQAIARIREVPGGEVPIIFLCNPDEEAIAMRVADGVVVRPVAPERVVARARDLMGLRKLESGEFATAGSSARKRSPSQPAARTLAGQAIDPPSLRPLAVERAHDGGSRGGGVPNGAPWLRGMAASIEQAMDIELESTLSEVTAARQGLHGPRPTETTRHVPRELVDSLLASAGSATAVSLTGSSARLHERLARAPGEEPGVVGASGDLAGDLARVDLATLLGRAFADGLTGRLRLRRGEVEKTIFFEAGRPVLAASSAVQDRMVQMLVRSGKVSPADAQRAVAVATESGRRMGAVLIDLGLLKSSELLPAVRQHYEEIVTSLFSWEEGTFRFEVGAVADPKRVRLLRHPAALVIEGVRRGFTPERARQRAGGSAAVLRLEARASASDILLEIAGADSSIARVPVLWDGVRTLADVVRLSALPESLVCGIAVTLRAFGLLVDTTPQGRAVPALDVVAARDREIDRERINARHALVREGDYFAVLGLGADATADDARAAAAHLGRELSDEVIGPELARELATPLAEIRVVLGEAVRILCDDDLRAAYRSHVLAAVVPAAAALPESPSAGAEVA